MTGQTLSVGQTPQQRYSARLGGYTGKASRPATALCALIIGLPGCGKSAFMQTCKDAYILDFDLSGTTASNPQAVMWPGLNTQGQPIDDQGNPFVPQYEHFKAKIDILLEMASNKDPDRPKIVVLDTLSKWKEMCEDWIVRNCQKLNISREKVDNWKDLNGMSAYGFLYGEIRRTINQLSDAGYGVYVIGHVYNTITQLEEGKNKFHYKLTITDNFWSQLHHSFHYIGAMDKQTRTVVTKETIKDPRDPSKTMERPVKETKTVFMLGLVSNDFEGIVKNKVRLPSVIELPEEGAFDYFQSVYSTAIANS